MILDNVAAIFPGTPRPLYRYEVQVGLFLGDDCLARAFYTVVANTADGAHAAAVALAEGGRDGTLPAAEYRAIEHKVLHRIV